jgi:hypothetical protein
LDAPEMNYRDVTNGSVIFLLNKPLVARECRLSPVRRQLTRGARARRTGHEIEKIDRDTCAKASRSATTAK